MVVAAFRRDKDRTPIFLSTKPQTIMRSLPWRKKTGFKTVPHYCNKNFKSLDIHGTIEISLKDGIQVLGHENDLIISPVFLLVMLSVCCPKVFQYFDCIVIRKWTYSCMMSQPCAQSQIKIRKWRSYTLQLCCSKIGKFTFTSALFWFFWAQSLKIHGLCNLTYFKLANHS